MGRYINKEFAVTLDYGADPDKIDVFVPCSGGNLRMAKLICPAMNDAATSDLLILDVSKTVIMYNNMTGNAAGSTTYDYCAVPYACVAEEDPSSATAHIQGFYVRIEASVAQTSNRAYTVSLLLEQ